MESQFTIRIAGEHEAPKQKVRSAPSVSTLSIVDSATMMASPARRNVTSGAAAQAALSRHQASSTHQQRRHDGASAKPRRWNAAMTAIAKTSDDRATWRIASPLPVI